MKTITVTPYYRRPFWTGLLCLLFVSFLVNGQTTSSFLLDAQHVKKISVNASAVETGEIASLSTIGPVTGLAISGSVSLKNSQGFVRVLLKDKYGSEYLVYEANSFSLDGLTASLNRIGEETKQLQNVVPASLRVELSDASLTVSEVVYVPGSAGNSFRLETDDSLRYKQAKEKSDQINSQIKKKGQKWRAGVTSVSLLSYEQKKTLFGGKVPNLQGAEYYKGGVLSVPNSAGVLATASASAGSSLYTDSFDWRNRHGQNWITPVTNQGGCSSCWAFATAATAEQLVNLYYNRHLNLDLSEQDALSCSGAGTCAGGNTNSTLDYIMATGLVNETCFPYAATDLPCTTKCSNPQERIKIGGYENWNGGTEDVLKAMIIKGPVSGGLSSWWHTMNLVSYQTVKVGDKISLNDPYNIVTIQAGDPLIGTTVWTFKNSWGPDYGDNGYVTVTTPMDNFYLTHRLYGPITSKNYTTSYINCTDADGDGYYFWGLGTKPAHCPASPAEPDGDDSNPTLGPVNQYGYCTVIGNQYTVTASATNGSIALSPAGPYLSGTTVTATAVPNPGYKFNAWGGALSGTTNPTTILVNGNKSISATFTAVPVVTITEPAQYAYLANPTNVTVKATATISGATISKVEFFRLVGTTRTKLGEDASSPYTYTLTNVPIGTTYNIIAKATASNSATAETQVTFYITPPNTPPTVYLAAPANNTHFASPASFELSASATDQESPISKVEFYQGSVKIGEDAFYPGFTWGIANLASGTYTFTAKAFDQGGLSTISAPITIIVDAPACLVSEPTPPAAQWVLRNDWYDQNSGSLLSNESSALKVTHRAWGQSFVWLQETATFPVQSGKTYQIKFDFKDNATVAINGIEAGFGSGYGATGPVLAQPAVSVASGYSSSAFTTKTVNLTSTWTGYASLALKLKWTSQPTAQVVDYIKNVSVCQVSTGASFREEEATPEISFSQSVLSPNPVDDRVLIQMNVAEAELELVNSTGTSVLSRKVTGSTVELDVRELASGIYSVLLKNGESVQKLRFVKR